MWSHKTTYRNNYFFDMLFTIFQFISLYQLLKYCRFITLPSCNIRNYVFKYIQSTAFLSPGLGRNWLNSIIFPWHSCPLNEILFITSETCNSCLFFFFSQMKYWPRLSSRGNVKELGIPSRGTETGKSANYAEPGNFHKINDFNMGFIFD